MKPQFRLATFLYAGIASLLLMQSAASQSMKLSFDQAWQLALRDNDQIRSARVNLDKAEAQIGEAVAAALPSLTATAYYQRNFIVPEMVAQFAGETIRIRLSQENFLNGGVELTQPIYAAGRVGRALQIAKLYRQVSQEQVGVTRAETKLQVTKLYFGAVLAQQWEKVAAATYQQMQDHLQQVEAMQKEGLVSEYDLIRSRVQVSNFYPQVIASQSAKQVAFEALNIALGLPKNQELELTDGMDGYQATDVPSEDLFLLAVQGRGELRQLDLQERILSKLATIEGHGVWWPNLALVGGFTIQAQAPDFDFNNYYWSKNVYGGLSLSIPIFDGFRAHQRVQQVRADQKLLQLQHDQLEKGINLELVQARSKLEEAQKNVKAQEEGVELAKKGLKIAEVQYSNGLATQLEVMDAQIALNQAQMNELNARYDLITARAALQKALGRE